MTMEVINIGALPNDGTGDPLRVAFDKINTNFLNLDTVTLARGPNGSLQFNDQTTGNGATGTAVIVEGALVNITIDDPGTNYKAYNPPTITITNAVGDTTGSGALASAVVDDLSGEVSGIIINDPGVNYTLPPIVAFSSTTNKVLQGSDHLIYDKDNYTLTVSVDVIPDTTNVYSLGSNTKVFGNIYLGANSTHIGNVRLKESNDVLSVVMDDDVNVGAGISTGNVFANTITINGNTYQTSTQAVTFSTTANQVIFQVPTSQFLSGQFEVVSVQANSTNSQSITIKATKKIDDSGVRYIGYGTMRFGNIVISDYNMDVNSGNVRLKVTPTTNEDVTHTISVKLER